MENREIVFNLFAYIIKVILSSNTTSNEFTRIETSVMVDKVKISLVKILRAKIPQIVDSRGGVKILSTKDLNRKLILDLVMYIREYEHNIECLLLLLHYLDCALEPVYSNSVGICEDIEKIEPLNCNFESIRIAIFPRVRCEWEHKSQGSYYHNSIENFIKYFYFCELDDLKDIEVHNYRISSDVARDAMNKGKLVIGVSPLTCEKILIDSKYKRNDNKYFKIVGLDKKDILRYNLKSIIEKAYNKKVDILVFPEMLGDEKIIKEVQKDISHNAPPIIVWPSVWHAEEDNIGNSNKCIITIQLGAECQEVCKQSKNRCFVDPEQNIEDISKSNPWIVNILHVEGFGRIGILICKDFLDRKNRELLLAKLKTTLILVPSFSTGEYSFDTIIAQGKEFDCNIVWVNSCSAETLPYSKKENFEIIASITNFTKKRMGDAPDNQKFKRKCSRKECSQCLYVNEIPF